MLGRIDPNGLVHLLRSFYCLPGYDDTEFLYEEEGATAYLRQKGVKDPWVITGPASGQRVELKWYEYAFSSEVRKVQVSTSRDTLYLAGGRFEIGEVSNLQLVIGERAVANFAWQASLDKLGHIMLGEAKPNGNGTAEFAKKPDGSWVLVRPVRF